MFNTLNHSQQQEVKAIVVAMGEENIQSLRKITAEIFPDSTYLTHLEFVHNLVADYVSDSDTTCADMQNEDLIEPLFDVMYFFCEMCNDFIKYGDKLPTENFVDFVRLDFANTNDSWREHIRNNLNHISHIAGSLHLNQVHNATTAMFKCVVNTAFDFSMNDSW